MSSTIKVEPRYQSTGPEGTSLLNSSRTARSGYGWLCCAIALFLLQVLPYLSHRWVTDESWYAGPAYSIAHGGGVSDPEIGPNDLEHTFDARPPANFLVMASSFKLFGASQVTARLGSVLAGVLIVVLVFQLSIGVLGKEGAILAAFLAASDNLIVLVSKAARPEALTVMAILAALLAMQQYAEKRTVVWAALSGLLMAVGTMFHITLLGFIVSAGLLAIIIDKRRGDFPLRGAIPYSLGYFAGLLPFGLWLSSDPIRRAAFRYEYLSRTGGQGLLAKLTAEGHRYTDILGYKMLHGHGLEAVPVRLPIPLFFLFATWLLWRYRRSWFYLELVLIVPTMLWLVETVNRSSRYLSLLSPVIGLTIAAAVVATRGRHKLHRFMLAGAVLVIAAQVGANLILLKGARKANYDKVGAELRSVIPQGQTAYGTITFWLALRDSPYISYERTEPSMAANKFHARYFIVGDPTMSSGGDWDPAFYSKLLPQLAEVVAHSDLVGHFPDPYYGDLKVYRLRD
jgi:4-amino-4-deoxy-L-arabinose transferase-like glycosyltransferase